ncbi:hypothetical protein [Amycolatopsis magusensis]|uniref:hypothetical protein n=1 Tax=Amycolatopsis magusensis TaxID=882444 RepID=UPI00379E7D51
MEDDLMTRHNHARRRAVRDYMARHGVKYAEALRAITGAEMAGHPGEPRSAPLRPLPAEQGGPSMPAVVARDHDVNDVCGHWLGAQCVGCGVCTTCDSCFCEVSRQEAELDAYLLGVEREHAQHWQEPGEDCPTCEDQQKRSKNFTECPTCGKALKGYWHFREHNAPRCLKDKPHPPGLDWSHLAGKRININNRWLYHGRMAGHAMDLTGTVTGRWTNLGTGTETTLYVLELDPAVAQSLRTDSGTTPFDPRGVTITEL